MTALKPDTISIQPYVFRTKEHVLIEHPELDATVSNCFLVHGYSDRLKSYQNTFNYMPLVMLDHIYHYLQEYRDTFKPRHAEKMNVNKTLSGFHNYFSIVLSQKNDDVMRLLDDMEGMQQLFTAEYRLLQYNLQNNNFHRRKLTDEQSRKYGYLVSMLTEFNHLDALAKSAGLEIDKGTLRLFRMIDGPLFTSVIPDFERMYHEDYTLCHTTIVRVNNIIGDYITELKHQIQTET